MFRAWFLIPIACASLAATADEHRFVAYHGVAQAFSREGLDAHTCTATRLLPPRHGFVDNTVASIAAAFALGAERVTFDIHPTSDGEFVVFHDWTLECRTDGHGVVREQPLAYLKTLDIGHGYTADGGATHPYRGRFVGAMPTWAEVMAAFPGRRFIVNIKSNDPREVALVEAYVARHGIDLRSVAFQGGGKPIAALRRLWPEVRAASKTTMQACAWRYVMIGWTGHVPEACRRTIVFVPLDYQRWLWGWPERFVERMEAAGSLVVVIGPIGSRRDIAAFTTIDDPGALASIPAGYRGLVSTAAIDLLGGR